MQAQPKHTEIKHHRVLESWVHNTRGRALKVFKLQYNPRLGEEGVCRGIDTEVFFPDKELFRPEEEAAFVRMCAECPVMEMCQEWALAHERYGVWGGLTPYRRIIIRKQRNWEIADPRLV